MGQSSHLVVDGKDLTVTNLSKLFYPQANPLYQAAT